MCTSYQALVRDSSGSLIFVGEALPPTQKALKTNSWTYKRWLFSVRARGGVIVPCLQCLECRIMTQRNKAFCVTNEAKYYKKTSFITLTYNDQNLPVDGSCKADHVVTFIKDLRAYICRESGCFGKRDRSRGCRGMCPKIKTFGCQEYGPALSRPHYHLCVLGYQFDDLSSAKKVTNDWGKSWFTYRSKICAEIWKKGFIEVAHVTPAAAAYVSGYVTKKITGKKAKGYYCGKEPERSVGVSKGLGARWLHQNVEHVLRHEGLVSFRGSKMFIPRYYWKLLKKFYPETLEKLKAALTKNSPDSFKLSKRYDPERMSARDAIIVSKQKMEKRNYESAGKS